jgi:glycosyltransferase involved in cell wall biosynthesis
MRLLWEWIMKLHKQLWSWFKRRQQGKGISIVIPFRAPKVADERVRNFEWLVQYWRFHLPAAEVIVGEDREACRPFSKAVAVNNGVNKAHGDIIVIADADGYLPSDLVLLCAAEIRNAKKRGYRLWFIPFRNFYRLSNAATLRLLNSDIREPYVFPAEVTAEDIVNLRDANPAIAHRYGALMQIMPREAFDILGGWDERMVGWGGEDHAAMRATDTLYGPHKTLPSAIYHLWHPMLGDSGTKDIVDWKERRWEGQDCSGNNNLLSYRYYHATGKPKLMRALCDEWHRLKREGRLYPCPPPPKHPCPGHSI